jgi:hypothetical protein
MTIPYRVHDSGKTTVKKIYRGYFLTNFAEIFAHQRKKVFLIILFKNLIDSLFKHNSLMTHYYVSIIVFLNFKKSGLCLKLNREKLKIGNRKLMKIMTEKT